MGNLKELLLEGRWYMTEKKFLKTLVFDDLFLDYIK